jgi:acyl carrier protein
MVNGLLSDDEIFRQLVKIIVEALRVDPETISLKSNILTDFDAESIDLVDIRFRIEETFGFRVDQEEFIQGLGEGLSPAEIGDHITVERVVGYIKRRLTQQAEA